MAIPWVLPVRVVQLVFAIVELGLTAYGKFRRPQLSSCPLPPGAATLKRASSLSSD